VRHPRSLGELGRRPWELFWVNATSAAAWIAFFYALRIIEPSLVQVLFSGIGPLTIAVLDRLTPRGAGHVPLSRAEWPPYLGILASLLLAAFVALAGLSGAGPQPLSVAALGVLLAAGSGISISVNTVLCKNLNEAGVNPEALVSVRFIGAVLLAMGMMAASGDSGSVLPPATLFSVAAASLVLIVFPIYVNQVGVSLASPVTVRVVLTLGPVLVFLLQLLEGRLMSSPYSLTVAVLYSACSISAAVVRHRAIRSTAIARAMPSERAQAASSADLPTQKPSPRSSVAEAR